MTSQQTTITLQNATPELLAQIEALLASANVKAETVTREIVSENVCGFLGLAIDTDKVKEDTETLFSVEAMAQAKALKAKNAQMSQSRLANLL